MSIVCCQHGGIMKLKYLLSILILTALTSGCSSSEKKEESSNYDVADNSSTEGDEIFESVGSEEASRVESASDVQEEPPVPQIAESATPDKEEQVKDDYNEPTTPQKKSAKRSKSLASSGGAFKAKMYTFKTDCEMKSDPSDDSANAGNVKAGKKLWVENHDADWATVQKKTGTVYVKKSCL